VNGVLNVTTSVRTVSDPPRNARAIVCLMVSSCRDTSASGKSAILSRSEVVTEGAAFPSPLVGLN
jgi:hypothetical protein